MQKIQTKGSDGNITYWVSKDIDHDKDTVFFLHGLTADHTMFNQQVEYFKQEYNIISWDAPAHGQSRPYGSFTYENAANDLKKIIVECGLTNIILIGQSMGGYISQAFICRFPNMVKAFISIDSTPYGNYYSKSDIWWLRQIEWMSKLFPEKTLKSAMSKQNAITKYGQANMMEMVSRYSKSEICHLMGIGYAGFLEDNRELKMSCPVILMVGEKDRTGKVKVYNKEWAKRTGYELIWIPNAAHNSNVDNAKIVNEHISIFLENLN